MLCSVQEGDDDVSDDDNSDEEMEDSMVSKLFFFLDDGLSLTDDWIVN